MSKWPRGVERYVGLSGKIPLDSVNAELWCKYPGLHLYGQKKGQLRKAIEIIGWEVCGNSDSALEAVGMCVTLMPARFQDFNVSMANFGNMSLAHTTVEIAARTGFQVQQMLCNPASGRSGLFAVEDPVLVVHPFDPNYHEAEKTLFIDVRLLYREIDMPLEVYTSEHVQLSNPPCYPLNDVDSAVADPVFTYHVRWWHEMPILG